MISEVGLHAGNLASQVARIGQAHNAISVGLLSTNAVLWANIMINMNSNLS